MYVRINLDEPYRTELAIHTSILCNSSGATQAYWKRLYFPEERSFDGEMLVEKYFPLIKNRALKAELAILNTNAEVLATMEPVVFVSKDNKFNRFKDKFCTVHVEENSVEEPVKVAMLSDFNLNKYLPPLQRSHTYGDIDVGPQLVLEKR